MNRGGSCPIHCAFCHRQLQHSGQTKRPQVLRLVDFIYIGEVHERKDLLLVLEVGGVGEYPATVTDIKCAHIQVVVPNMASDEGRRLFVVGVDHALVLNVEHEPDIYVSFLSGIPFVPPT